MDKTPALERRQSGARDESVYERKDETSALQTGVVEP